MARKTLLIVDDEGLFTRSLADGLSTLEPSLNVLTAKDGQVAIDTLERESVDLVLTDLKMPVVDGFQLLAYLNEKRRGLPVLVMTAFETPEIGQRLRALGVGDVVEKPVDFGRLADRVMQILSGGGLSMPPSCQLTGLLGAFSPFELLQMLSDLRKSGELVLTRPDGPTARCSLGPSGLGPAECGHLQGREALLTFLWWRHGSFVFELREDAAKVDQPLRVPEVLMDAVRLADEIERRKDVLPPRDAPLFLEADAELPADGVDCDLARVFEAVRSRPSVTGADLEAQLPLAPVKVRLALAVLAEAGCLLRPRQTPKPAAAAAEPASGFWKALQRHYPGGLRLLVAACGEPQARLYQAVSRLGETLGLASPPVSFSPDGPSFVRLRPASGGILSLTFLPISKKNRYLFETFVRSVEVAFVCHENVSLEREVTEWEALVPSNVRLLHFEAGIAMEESIAARLREVLAEAEPGRRSTRTLERTLS